MKETIKKELKESMNVKQKVLENLVEDIETIARIIIECYRNRKKVVLFGSGGSAADAQHIAGELISKFRIERKSLPAIALNVNTSVITAIGNDYDFSRVFEKQVEGLVNEGDVVIGISTSGNSLAVIKAIEKAKNNKAKTIVFTGRTGGKLSEISDVDIILKIPSDDTPRIQEAHITIGHIICGIVERELFGK